MQTKQNIWLNSLKAVVVSLIFTMIAILIFALILKVFSLPNSVIKPVNYLIKCLSVFLGCYLSISEEKGILKGFITGAIIMLFSHLIFSLIGGVSLTFSIIWELLLGGAVGAITGTIAVNKK